MLISNILYDNFFYRIQLFYLYDFVIMIPRKTRYDSLKNMSMSKTISECPQIWRKIKDATIPSTNGCAKK